MAPSLKKKLQQPSAKRRSRYALVGVVLSILFLSSSVSAENPIITGISDYWFEYTEPTQFEARTYYIDGYNSDPQLWLYSEQGVELVTNDDYFGLQSYISLEVQPGRYRLRAGTCCWQPDVWRSSPGWNERYELSFNGQPANTTSTTEEPTTTTSTSTTSTTTTTTTTTTSTTLAPTTTSTSTTTTTEVPTTTTVLPTTTTSTVPIPQTTVPPSTVPTTTTSTLAPTTTSTSTTSTVVQVPVQVTTTTIPAVVVPPVVSPEEATALATNPEALATITAEEATQVFEALVLDDLSDTELVQLVSAVQDAPVAVRESFEASVNVFGGAVDTYVPIGSTVPVKTRRALIAITIMTSLMVIPTKRK